MPERRRSNPMLVHHPTGRKRYFLLAVGCIFVVTMQARRAFGYIDPGTSQALWSSLAPLVAIVVGCTAVLLLPLRFAWGRVRSLWREWPKWGKILLVLGFGGVLAAAILGIRMLLL